MKIYNYIPYIIIIILTVIITKQCTDNKQFKSDIKHLENVKDSLNKEYLNEKKVADSLFKIKNKTIIEYKTIYKYKTQLQDEANNVTDYVYSLNERQLDSTIRSYKHTNRTKD